MSYNLKILGNSFKREDISTLHSYTFINGKKFPPSYVDFVEELGYGLACGIFVIYIPMQEYGNSILIRSEEIIYTYQDVLDDEEELWFDLEPDVSYSMLKDLIPFGTSENGHYLFWDIENGENNEFDIYITDFRGLGFKKVAKNLYEFINKATSKEKYKEILPFSEKPLSNTFEPFKA